MRLADGAIRDEPLGQSVARRERREGGEIGSLRLLIEAIGGIL